VQNLIGWRYFPNLLSSKDLEALRRDLSDAKWGDERGYSKGYTARNCQMIEQTERFESFRKLLDSMRYAIDEANHHFCFDLADQFESTLALRYTAGDFVNWHYDLGPGRSSARKLSITVALNEPSDYEGGSFEFFPKGDLQPMVAGSALVFPSYMPHRVTEVTSGERIVAVGFFGGPEFR
jgi:predicted 2-oxoglutarate/Fe(II)-dependent dioxygenase YbiX